MCASLKRNIYLCKCLTIADLFQISVRAVDGGSPPRRSGNSSVSIDVARNLYAPVFEQRIYTLTVNENQPTNAQVLTVRATDSDSQVAYSLRLSDLCSSVIYPPLMTFLFKADTILRPQI